MPSFSLIAGTYTSLQRVVITASDPAAIVYCTVDGSTPTTSSSQCSQPIAVVQTETIKAIAAIPGGAVSDVASISYTVNLNAAPAPAFSVPAGTYTVAQNVSLSDTLSGGQIYYTTDGTTPTTNSTLYTAAIKVSTTETIRAMAVVVGYEDSPVSSVAYTINLPAATPVFTPAAGTYTSAQTVAISDATAGSTIYYTTSGTAPTTSSAVYTGPIPVAFSQTLEAIAIAPGSSVSAVATAAYTLSQTATATPVFAPGAGTYTNAPSVTITDATPGALIYYTTTGSNPTNTSTLYAGPVPVTATETLKAIAVAPGFNLSGTATAAYTVVPPAATPTFAPAGGTYNSVQTVTISDATPGTTIYYTTDGSLPSATNGIAYTGPVAVPTTETLQAVAVRSGYTNSMPASATYTLTLPPAAKPTFSPAPGTYTTIQNVSISDATSGATIYYTTSGAIPTVANGTVYSGPISVSATETIQAIAVLLGDSNSAVASAPYTINLPTAATPVLSVPSGTYTVAQTVSISDATPGASIYYTTNGVTPTATSTLYTAPVTVASTETLQAIAVVTGYNNSSVTSAAYTVNLTTVAAVVYSIPAGQYTGTQTLTLSDSTPGATIYYCLGCGTPTTSSLKYTGPITLSATQEIDAFAVLTGDTSSSIGRNYYTIFADPTPIISPNGGALPSGAQTVTITEPALNGTVPSLTLKYQTGGQAPGPFSGTSCAVSAASPSCTVTLTAPITLEVAAFSGTAQVSGVAVGTFTTGPAAAAPVLAPAAGTYSSAQTVSMTTTTPGATIFYTTNGSTPAFYFYGTTAYAFNGQQYYPGYPITVAANETVNAIAWAPGSSTSPQTTAVYTINAPEPPPTFSTPPGPYTYNVSVGFTDTDPNASIYYTTDGSTPSVANGTLAAGSYYTVPLGTTTINAIAIGGGGTSSVATGDFTVAVPLEPTPTLTPPGGTYTSAQSVLVSSADTSGNAEFYYTTDGSTPTELNGSPTGTTQIAQYLPGLGYGITVSASETLKVMASIAGGYGNGCQCANPNPADSLVVTAAYAINYTPAATPTFSPTAGTYIAGQKVALNDASPGSTIYYTLNGTTPTTSSTRYMAPITVSTTTTIKAVAISATTGLSGVGSGAFTITPGSSTLSGSVFSGTAPVSGAAVQLYAAGQTGYGSAATALLASPVTTTSTGAFTIPSFTCPASPGDQVYAVATHGGTASGGQNANLALMTALGACANLNMNSPVWINEVTTVASVYALSGFMSKAPNVGSSATNYAGLANAFLTANNLVNTTTGQALSITPYFGAQGATSGGFLNSSYVPQARINTLANMLNACTSTSGVGGGSSNCSNLFSDAAPATGTVPTDTLQAALDIAQNPGNNVAKLFGVASTAFSPALTSTPTDWTLALTFTGGGLGTNPANAPSQAQAVTSLAIDATGDVWATGGNSLIEFNNQGVPLSPAATAANNYVGGYTTATGGLSIAIDTAGDAWVGTSSSTKEISSTGTLLKSALIPGNSLAFDYSGNLWSGGNGLNSVYKYNTSTSTSQIYSIVVNNSYIAVATEAFDVFGNLWGTVPGQGTLFAVYPGTLNPAQYYNNLASPVFAEGAEYGVAADSNGNVFSITGQTPGSITQQTAAVASPPPPNYFQYPLPTNTAEGVTAIALDGTANVWGAAFSVANPTTTTVATSPSYLVKLSNSGTLLSPSVSGSVFGYTGTGGGGETQPILSNIAGGPVSLAIDGSGNIWAANPRVANTTSAVPPGQQIVEFIGLGTPVITPTALAVKNNAQATQP